MKKLFAVFILLSFSLSNAFAVGTPVFDIANLMQAIDQFYATYDHINATIEQVQNTYKQLEKQIEMVKSINFDDIDFSMSEGGFLNLPDIRDPINSVTNKINYNMNLLNNVKNTLTKKKINFGGKNYTISGLIGIGRENSGTTIFDLPKNIVDYGKESLKEAAAGWAGKKSYAERAAIMRKHGLDPENYFIGEVINETLGNMITDLFTTSTQEHTTSLIKNAAEQQNIILELMKGADESVVGNLQATSYALFDVGSSITRLELGLNNFAGFFAQKELKDQYLEEAEKTRKELEARQRIQEQRARDNGFTDWY